MKFIYKDSCGLPTEELQQTAERALDYAAHLNAVSAQGNYDDPECSIVLPADAKLFKRSADLACQVLERSRSGQGSGNKLRYIIDIGIGGSNLGTKAVYDALFGYFDVIEPERYPKMIYADTNDPEFLSKLQAFIRKNIKAPEEILIAAISKSGGTTETMFNLEACLDAFKDSGFLARIISERLVVISDEGSAFWNAAEAKQIKTLPLPKLVGGRYSVLSPVGIYPLMVCGIDVDDLREGALNMRAECLTTNASNNPALLSACILYLQNMKGRHINDNFIFHPELESAGKWYRQLMGESVGKATDLSGATVNVGLTPTVSIGSTDLHSVGQLYLGGPFDKITTFITSGGSQPFSGLAPEATLGSELEFPAMVSNIENRSSSTIMRAILEGTKNAYKNAGRPFTTVELDDISPRSIGEFFQFKMMEMMYLGHLMNVNTFDQPNVESYKIETKKILSS